MRTELRAVRELRRARRLRLSFALSSQRDLDLAKWQAIHHIVFGKPAFARDANAEPQILQSLRAMSVRVDYTFNTFLFGQRPPTPVQIQPLWRGVELNPCAGPCRRVQDCGDVDLVRFAFQEQTASRMRQHRNEGILDRADHARCHFRFVQIKDGMHGCDHIIEL